MKTSLTFLFGLFQMNGVSKDEFVLSLRRQNTSAARGTSKFRGVTLHKCGRWEARMGQYLGRKWENLLNIELTLILKLWNESGRWLFEFGLLAGTFILGCITARRKPQGTYINLSMKSVLFFLDTYMLTLLCYVWKSGLTTGLF